MKIVAITDKAEALYKAINKAITDEKLKTWELVENSDNEILYSHSPEQWRETAMLKPQIEDDKLTLTIKWWKSKGDPGEAVKGYITGRFTEVLLVHFNKHFTQLNTFA
ncbi:hypothetical protein SAMN05428975_5136 [Mucilaginibacter sp. OK268]|jgi:hypothetical protein|uniref:hypothetical protein n=1 Tax=Mucilaginibacter sp. OK268 TaxID=1881048 RepID=UPI00088EC0BD|nr:hypothetical protein [Mucilaginibacter sp. OK268]SDP99731.1 hypothetical protein SAMN05428975_5136 [Mucilaginibacter sp. OK268]